MIHKTVQRGIDMGLVRYDDTPKGNYIVYIHAQKRLPMGKPEEWVRLLSYLHLILLYDYPPEHIAIEYPIKMGSSYRYADIVVFEEVTWQKVHILVECKRDDIGKTKFEEGIKQAISYANQINPNYIWITSGENNSYYTFKQYHASKISKIPPFSAIRRWWDSLTKIFKPQ